MLFITLKRNLNETGEFIKINPINESAQTYRGNFYKETLDAIYEYLGSLKLDKDPIMFSNNNVLHVYPTSSLCYNINHEYTIVMDQTAHSSFKKKFKP